MGQSKWICMCVLLWTGMSLSGCALTSDVEMLDQRTARLQSQMSQLQKENQTLRNELSTTRTDVGGETKRGQADLLLKIDSLESEVRSLSTEMGEYKDYLKRPSKEIGQVKEDVVTQTKLLEERTKVLEDRMKLLEEGLKTTNAKMERLTAKQQETEKSVSAREMTSETKAASLSRGAGDLYKDAYESFQKGDLQAARRKFEAFMKQYPNTELSDNAQFWIGETYYLKKDYEKAILEYEKAISKYPEGDKVPAALFKQGLAFLELGDKTNGRNLLKRVIERYPHSDQAEMAKKRLDTIK